VLPVWWLCPFLKPHLAVALILTHYKDTRPPEVGTDRHTIVGGKCNFWHALSVRLFNVRRIAALRPDD
jgi:hypothetical protein